jgi:O-antigen/teichoic acid export membrane protein
VGTVGIAIAIDFGQVLRAHFIFPECRIDISAWWHRSYIQKLFSFAGWQLFGSFGSLLRGSGTAILLNKYFPPSIFPAVNASYSIGNTVSGHTQTLSGALLGAFTPEITSTEGRGDRQRMLSLANKASKFGVWLILLFAVPLLLEVQGVLTLWLKRPPELAATFCVLIIMQFLIEQLTFGHRVAVNAVGKIAGYQMMLGGLLILTLPIAWLFLAYGFPAQAVAWAFILTSSGLSIGRVIWARWLVGLSPWVWMRDVLVPCLSIFALTGLAGYCVRWLWGGFSFYRLCTVTFVTVVVWGIAGWLLILGPSEKHTLFSTIKKIKQKVV